MSENSSIPWTKNTASPWFGCTEVSLGCTNCYARELTLQKFAYVNGGGAEHSGVVRQAYFKAGFANWATRPAWGRNATRVLARGFWENAPRWDKRAAASGERTAVFPSLMDWLDDFPQGCVDQDGRHLAKGEPLALLLGTVASTPNLDWLLLTKRVDCFADRLREAAEFERSRAQLFASSPALDLLDAWNRGRPPANVKLGVSVERQAESWRAAALLELPAAYRFVSAEPLLEYVDFSAVVQAEDLSRTDCLRGAVFVDGRNEPAERPKLDCVIVGLESGAERRDPGVECLTRVADDCVAAGVRVFVKQDSALLPDQRGRIPDRYWAMRGGPL